MFLYQLSSEIVWGKGMDRSEGNLYLISSGLSVNTCHWGGGSVIQQYVFFV